MKRPKTWQYIRIVASILRRIGRHGNFVCLKYEWSTGVKLYNFETEFFTTVTTFGQQMDLSQWHRQWNTFVEKELWVSLQWGWSEQFPKPWNGFLILNHIYLHTNWDSYNANKEECDGCESSHFLQERLVSAQLSERKHENVIPLQSGSLSWLWDTLSAPPAFSSWVC